VAVETAGEAAVWAVGGAGTVLYSSDDGAVWRAPFSGVSGTVHDVDFTEPSTGILAGDDGEIAISADNGLSWVRRSSETSRALFGVTLADEDTAWVVGAEGTVLASADGGVSWSPQVSETTEDLHAAASVSTTRAWAAGSNGTAIATVDSGATWTSRSVGSTATLTGVDFADPLNGWAVGSSGTIAHTSDGGVTWTLQVSGTSADLRGIDMADASRGWAVGGADGSPGVVLRTTDGGITWTPQVHTVPGAIYSVSARSADEAWVVGEGGAMRRTSDGGATWSDGSSGSHARLNAVAFAGSTSTGWAVGESGSVLHTSDGVSWTGSASGVFTDLRDVDAVSTSHAWAVGAGGTILYTSTGTEWSAQTSGVTASLNGVDFADGLSGWAAGDEGTVLATTNGGGTWVPQSVPTSAPLHAVAFADPQNGWVVGGNAISGPYASHTSDGGSTWTTQTVSPQASGPLRAVAFADALTGWAVGDDGTVLATGDGGSNWTAQASNTSADLFGVFSADAANVCAVGGAEDGSSVILRTQDGGATWTRDLPGTGNTLRSVAFTSADVGWAVGDAGTVLRTTGTTAPTTTLNVTPVDPDGASGWYVTAPTVELSSNQPGITYFSFESSAGPWATYSEPQVVQLQGVSELFYHSADPAENAEEPSSVTLSVDTVAPPAPPALSATASGTGEITLLWLASLDTASGTDLYEVQMNGSIVGTTTVTSMTLGGLEPETQYEFAVKAFDVAGNESALSATASATTMSEQVRPPAFVYARAVDNGRVYVNWAESTGTVSPVEYRIWRSRDGGPFEVVGSRPATAVAAFVDTTAPSSADLSYAVSVVDSRGQSVRSSAQESADTNTPLLTAPSGLAALPETGTVTLSWNAHPDEDVAGYRVYRASTSTNTPAAISGSLVTATSYADSTVASRGEYWYRVAAVDASGTAGRMSAPVYARASSAASATAPPHGTYTASSHMCRVCHGVHGSSGPLLLNSPDGLNDVGLCLSCHDGTSATDIRSELMDTTRSSRHPIAVTGTDGVMSCSACHRPHAGGAPDSPAALLVAGEADGPNSPCYACHGAAAPQSMRGDLRVFEDSSHATGEPMTGVTGIACQSCHVSHSTREEALSPFTAEDRCLRCHSADSGLGAADIAYALSGPDRDTRHDLLLDDQAASGSRLACGNCHEPHASSESTPLVDPDSPTTSDGWAGDMDGFCLRCHDASLPTAAQTGDWVDSPLGDGGTASTIDIAQYWDMDWHGPRAGNPSTLRADMGYSSGDPLACDACHDPHGSANTFGLAESVESADGETTVHGLLVYPIPEGGYDMRFFCGACHDINDATHPGGTGGSGPGGGGSVDLTQFPVDCTSSSCHSHAGPHL